MKNISQTSIILLMFFFFIQVNRSSAGVTIEGAVVYPLIAQLAAMIYHGSKEGGKAGCCNSKDDNRTFAKKVVDVTTHAAAYSCTFAGYHFIQAALEAQGLFNEENSKRAAVAGAVLFGAATSAVANKLGDLMLYGLPCCSITKERQSERDEEVQLHRQ